MLQWEALLSFRIHSRRNPGADGLALWYVETPSKYDPNNKGSQPNLWGNNVDFKGLGIIFDTYDNDGQRDNPVVSVIYGAGDPNQKWDIENDLNAQVSLFVRGWVGRYACARVGADLPLPASPQWAPLFLPLLHIPERPIPMRLQLTGQFPTILVHQCRFSSHDLALQDNSYFPLTLASAWHRRQRCGASTSSATPQNTPK